MASPAAQRSPPADTAHSDAVQSPRISAANALARYEYDPTPGGTKMLMVEWTDDDATRGVRGEWRVSWPGCERVLPAADQQHDVHRMYFLLAAGSAVPTRVTLTHRPQDGDRAPVVWHTNPLPALFPPELGASAGKKGVLHTLWAKKRLQVLQREISAESADNAEGVGLLMAVQEREWIEQTFGVSIAPAPASAPASANGPASPRHPAGRGRLLDRLAGLKLSTATGATTSAGDGDGPSTNPLSPDGSDIAISSFSSFALLKGETPSSLAAKPPQLAQPQPQTTQTTQTAQTAQTAQPAQTTQTTQPAQPTQPTQPPGKAAEEDHDDDGLFASPIDPRSPEMGRSPFSF
ncbi:uncharacterized protein M421DRAFT_60127 [Didymella exigua CBS 183.55]|uniref:Uncharacterized protein n=1 Tax=Didymella exigua CBS 183.55 TaxID=1150837 RepID=A0A6A5RT96_9PLEO|nr:uncharacterized protein M421DRAFT_60127 [Didymella exigua CBS 183.55]KAF1929546.1 hypothetical protein M421DRAFT_60127 [Didymella exigua CBS 183.55]